MYYGGVMFDPNPRVRRASLGALVSGIGIFLGGMLVFLGTLLPWQRAGEIGGAEGPYNAFAVAGPFAWALAIIGGLLFVAAGGNMLNHSRRFNLGMQISAIAGGIAALALVAAAPTCKLSLVFPGNSRGLTSSEIRWFEIFGCAMRPGIGPSAVRTGAMLLIASAVIVLLVSSTATLWRRRQLAAQSARI